MQYAFAIDIEPRPGQNSHLVKIKEWQEADLAYFRAFELVPLYFREVAAPTTKLPDLAKTRFYIPVAKALVAKLQLFAPDVGDLNLRRDLQKLAMHITLEMDEELRRQLDFGVGEFVSERDGDKSLSERQRKIHIQIQKFLNQLHSSAAVLRYASAHLDLILHNAMTRNRYKMSKVESRFLHGLADALQLILNLNQQFVPDDGASNEMVLFSYRENLAAAFVRHTGELFSIHSPRFVTGDNLRIYIATIIERLQFMPRAETIGVIINQSHSQFWDDVHRGQIEALNDAADKILAIASPWHWSAEHCLRLLMPGPTIPTSGTKR